MALYIMIQFRLLTRFFRLRAPLSPPARAFGVWLCLIVLAATGPALALDYEYSTSEQVGFAFYKLGGAPPPFEKWIMLGEDFGAVTLRDREPYINAHRK